MRGMLMAASLAALIGLSACDTKEEAAAPPPPPKSMARPQQMYAGQEQIAKIDSAAIKVSEPGKLQMTAAGSVGMAGYKNAAFLPRINAAPPKDGVYEVDVVADKPAAPGAAAVTPIEIKKAWAGYPADHLKGVKFFAKTNSVVAMLPAS
ncbi:hypothetical protein [Phenylobacterium sp.]|uniref:hypothetical protein n=1 Tax=Phenylobacterium sp. TaxID=1871053 RepID=UPI003563E3A1